MKATQNFSETNIDKTMKQNVFDDLPNIVAVLRSLRSSTHRRADEIAAGRPQPSSVR